MTFTANIHGGRRSVTVVASNAERVLYSVSERAEDGRPGFNAANCCMSRDGFEQRFGVALAKAA